MLYNGPTPRKKRIFFSARISSCLCSTFAGAGQNVPAFPAMMQSPNAVTNSEKFDNQDTDFHGTKSKYNATYKAKIASFIMWPEDPGAAGCLQNSSRAGGLSPPFRILEVIEFEGGLIGNRNTLGLAICPRPAYF